MYKSCSEVIEGKDKNLFNKFYSNSLMLCINSIHLIYNAIKSWCAIFEIVFNCAVYLQ